MRYADCPLGHYSISHIRKGIFVVLCNEFSHILKLAICRVSTGRLSWVPHSSPNATCHTHTLSLWKWSCTDLAFTFSDGCFFSHRNVQRWTVALMSFGQWRKDAIFSKSLKKVFCSIPPSLRELNRIWRSEKKPTLRYQPSPGQFKEVRSTDLKEIENIKKKQILTGFRKANGRLTVFGSSF